VVRVTKLKYWIVAEVAGCPPAKNGPEASRSVAVKTA